METCFNAMDPRRDMTVYTEKNCCIKVVTGLKVP